MACLSPARTSSRMSSPVMYFSPSRSSEVLSPQKDDLFRSLDSGVISSPTDESGRGSSGIMSPLEIVGDVTLFTKDVTPHTARAAEKILRAWKEYVNERFGMSRAAVAKAEEGKEAELRAHLEEDRVCKDEYLEVIGRISAAVSDVVKTGNCRVRMLLNKEKATLAIASYSVDPRPSLYIDLIATAPENLKMHAPNPDTRDVFKGGGTVLMHSLYLTAQELELPLVRLKPLNGSASFYESLDMKFHRETDEFHFPVTPSEGPPTLSKKIDRMNLRHSLRSLREEFEGIDLR